MRKVVYVVALVILMAGVVGLATETRNLTPRVITGPDGVVYLFDNETGETQSALVVVLGGAITLEASDIVAIGGGDVTGIDLWGGGAMAKIDVEVVAGGTLQITLAGSNASGEIDTAWFAL